MRLGTIDNPPHTSPDEWAEKLHFLGVRSVVLPCGENTPGALLDRYLAVCREMNWTIAEVGAWSNPCSKDPEEAEKSRNYCKRQLAFADHIGARCCVNIAGTNGGPQWDGPYLDNYGRDAIKRVRDSVCEIIDSVKPTRTFYTLEPMPWMIPDSPEQYLELIEAVSNERFAVHMDLVNMISSPKRYFFNRDFMDRSFRLLKGRIRACHVKDVKIGDKLTLHLSEVPCGEGNIDLRHYAELATAEDPDMPFLIEHLDSWNAYEASFRFLCKRLAACRSEIFGFGKSMSIPIDA